MGSTKQKLGVCVALLVALWVQRADAAVTINPSLIDVGTVSLQPTNTTGTATGTLNDPDGRRVTISLTSDCSGSGTGTFDVSPNAADLGGGSTTVTVTYDPATAGTRTCAVEVRQNGNDNLLLTFFVRGTGQNPAALSVAASASLGNVRFNDAAPVHTSSANIVVTNTGGATLNISNVALDNTTDFSFSGGTSANINGGSSRTWTVTFDPLTAGSKTANLTFTSNAAGSPHSVALSGIGTNAIINVTPTPELDFGTVNIGSQLPADVTVQNIGQTTRGALGVSRADITGGDGWFTFTGCGGGTTCTVPFSVNNAVLVGIKCTPPTGATTAKTATVTFTSDTDDAAGTPAKSTGLKCTPGFSQVSSAPGSVAFPSQLITTKSSAIPVTITNAGTNPATFYFMKTGAQASMFTITSPTGCGLASGSPCSVAQNMGTFSFSVDYTPGLEGDVSAGLLLVPTFNVTSGAHTSLTLAGRGIDRHISVGSSVIAPDTFRNPNDTEPPVPITVKNTGEYPLTITQLQIDGQPIWDFVDPTVPITVPGSSSHDIMIRFAPDGAGKAPDGIVVINSDDTLVPMSRVTMTGNGKDRNVQMLPGVIDFGDTGAGIPTRFSLVRPDEMREIMNMDTVDFRIREIRIEDGDDVFSVQDSDGNAVTDVALVAGGTNTFDVMFTPTGVGEFTANVKLYLDQDPSPQATIPIRGRALFVDAHGSGGFGCSTGHGTGGGLVLVLGALLLRRRRATLAALAALPAVAQAEPTRNIELSIFDPTPSTSTSSFQLQTADVGAKGEYVVSTHASYASNPLVIGTIQSENTVIRHHTRVAIGGAYAFRDRWELGAHMPFYLQSGAPLEPGAFGVAPADGAALGDLTVHGKAQLWTNPYLKLGAGMSVKAPTATNDEFAGTDLPTGRIVGLMSLTASPQLALHANAGAVIRVPAEFANIKHGSGMTWAAGVAYRMLDPLFVHLEAYGDVIPGGRFSEPQNGETMGEASMLATIEALAGVRYQATRGLSFGLAAGRGLTNSIGTPDIRGVFTLAYAPGAPALPSLYRPPPPPPPVDPTKEDTDYDRLVDAVDKCPKESEDKDDFEDEDGCPDLDNDKDGVADAKDKCVMVVEDADKFEDGDGCPESDNDKDGIEDAKDKCPVQAEKINGKDDNDGCPDAGDALVISHPDRLELMDIVEFTGSELSKNSASLMAQLAATLRARTDIVRMRITVHVQPTKSAAQDKALSEKRASSMREWLIKWGIAEDRIEVRGFGGTKPLVKPTQKGAAMINDRVELIILERK